MQIIVSHWERIGAFDSSSAASRERFARKYADWHREANKPTTNRVVYHTRALRREGTRADLPVAPKAFPELNGATVYVGLFGLVHYFMAVLADMGTTRRRRKAA